MKTKFRFLSHGLCLLLLGMLSLQPSFLFAQGTAFTYQGRLNSGGSPASGTYDLTFSLWNAASGPAQVGTTLTNAATDVSNGLFAVPLDFGAGFPGADRWLEVGVRTNGAAGFITLSPRQQLTPTPYAITAAKLVSGGLPAGTYPSAVTFNNPGNTFSGSGAGLTSLNASNLTNGTVPDARLSANVALLNQIQTFTRTNRFAGIGIGAGPQVAPLQVVNSGPSGLTDAFTPSIWGDSSVGDGVFGSTAILGGYGVYGAASGTNGTGVFGLAGATGGVGVYGFDGVGSAQSDVSTPSVWGDSGTGDGVFGSTSATNGYGVYGMAGGAGGIGVFGSTTAANGTGVWAASASSNSPALTIGSGGFQVLGAGTNTGTAAFIQLVTSANLVSPANTATVIDNPLCNGDPRAIFIVTPRAPGNYNHVVNVAYQPGLGNRWAIYNADQAVMTAGQAFNVLVIKP